MGLLSSIGKIAGIGASLAGFPVVGAALGGLGSIMGGEEANSASQASTREQMQFQERMSSTAYERAVKDMQTAGLNPMLAYSQGGASSPAGSSYTAQDTATPALKLGNETTLANSAASLQKSQILNTNSSTELNHANVLKSRADALLSTAQAAKTSAEQPAKDVKSKFWESVLPTATSASDAVKGFSFKDTLKNWNTKMQNSKIKSQQGLDDYLKSQQKR